MSNSDNTKYWSCNDMMIILLQYDDHHLQFANCCFNHFLTKLADCSTRTFVCNFLQIIKNNFFVRFATFLLDHFVPDFQIVVLDHFLDFFNCHFTSFLFYKNSKLQFQINFFAKFAILGKQYLSYFSHPKMSMFVFFSSQRSI